MRAPLLALCCLLVAAASACDGSSTGVVEAGPDTLSVMTYNIFNDEERADYGIAPWTDRREAVADLLRAHGPDVIGLQEVEGWQVQWLLGELTGYEAVARGMAADAGDDRAFSVPVLYRADAFELEESGHFWYSSSPDTPGSFGGDEFGGLETPRMVTWVRLRRPGSDWGFYVFNTHFPANGLAADSEKARASSAALLVERIASRAHPDEPFLVTGDLNLEPWEATLRYLLGEGCEPGPGCPETSARLDMIDAWATHHGGGTGDGTRCNAVNGSSGSRVDYVLAWEPAARVLDADIVEWTGGCPSDHRPVTATVVVP